MAPSMPVRCTLLVIAILFAGIFTGCLSVRERLAARAERSGGDYRAERRSLASIAFAEYLYHSHTNTGNDTTRFGFCNRKQLLAVSVLGVAAIRRNLKNRRRLFQYGAHCLSGRERLAARAGRSGCDNRAEHRNFASIALAEYLYHSHTNTGNNAARSGFCIRG